MMADEDEDTERIRITSSCWLSKYKTNNFDRKKRTSNKNNMGIFPNFDICQISVVLPIIKLKNDLDCISENKKINRLRDKKNKEKIQHINIMNEEEISSIILRSKAFNETWKLLNHYMNCFIYNYLKDMIEKEINFLNNNLCLKNDKLSLLIIKTQSCPLVNLFQYEIISQKLRKLNNCDRKENEQENSLKDDILNYKNSDNKLNSYILLKKEKNIISCIINVHSHDTIESIITRIIKRISTKVFMKIDKNNLDDLFNNIVKKKYCVVIVYIKNYLKLKTSVFSGLLLYLTHLKEINSINISVIVTNSCVLSALNSLDFFIKKNVHVNICNLYLNYYNLIENIIFNPLFNNVLFKIKEYSFLIDNIFFYNHDFSFIKLKYFFYLFMRDFYDKKFFSFLNIPLNYFNVDAEEQKENEKYDYTNNFSTFKSRIIESFDLINVQNIHQKYLLLLYASNFYEKHINHLKYKSSYHLLYIINQLNKKKKKQNFKNHNNNNNNDKNAIKNDHDSRNNKNNKNNKNNSLSFPKRERENIRVTRSSNKFKDQNSEFEKEEGKKNIKNSNKENKIKNITLKHLDKFCKEDIDILNKKNDKKRKKENEFLYNCIQNFNFTKYEDEIYYSLDNSANKNIINGDEKENNNNEKIEVNENMSNINEKINSTKETGMNEIILHVKNNATNKKLKTNENFKNYYFQNYSLYNLYESLSPINRLANKDFIDDCNILKQYIINNLSRHMKIEHNIDSLKILKNEWSNNEYTKIYKYEKMISNMEVYLNKNKKCYSDNSNNQHKNKNVNTKKIKRNTRYVNIEEKMIQKNIKNEEGNIKKTLILYLHKCLVKSISQKMISFLYKKKKYNISIAIINIILKNIPTYSSMRKRIKFLKELFKKYEQKFIIKTSEDLKKANEEIEKELKQTLNTICDIVINLYINKISLLKKIMDEIYDFLKNISYVNKLEKYVNKNFSLNLPIFSVKLNHLIIYINHYMDLKKTKRRNFDEIKKNTSPVNQNFSISNEPTRIDSNLGNSQARTLQEEIKLTDIFNMNKTPMKSTDYEIIKGSHIDNIIENDSNNKKEKHNSRNILNGFINNSSTSRKKYEMNDNSLNYEEKKQIKGNIINYFKESDGSNDLNFLEFILIFFCEYFYFLLIPCIFLLPLSSECIAHEHGSDFFDIFNVNLQAKLLHILYYNVLDIKNLNNSSISLNYNYNFHQLKDTIKNCEIKKEDSLKNTDIKGEIIPFDMVENYKIEDIVVIFKILENMKTKYINGYNMFLEYVNIKLNSNCDKKNKKESIYCETFQELFYQYIIAIMTLFYFMKIIHIPSFFIKNKNQLEITNYEEQNNIHEIHNEDEIKEIIDSTKTPDENLISNKLSGDDKNVIPSFNNIKFAEDYNYKNYILDKLRYINIKKLIYGKNYIV